MLKYEKPVVIVLGCITELTGSGGKNNNDGWYYSRLA